MRNLSRLPILALLGCSLGLAAPWQPLAPADEGFRCQLPPGQLKNSKSAHARQWFFLAKGKYALQVASIAQPGTPSQVDFYQRQLLEKGHISLKGRKSITVNGHPALEVVGVIPPTVKAKVKVIVRIRLFATKDHIYSQSAFLTGTGYQKVADQFFGSFHLK